MSDAKALPGGQETGIYACLTIDDVAAGDGRRLQRIMDWLDAVEVRATFFLIPFSFPNQAPLYEDRELVDVLVRGREAGHEFMPHGYDHELFECGLPDLMCLHDEAMLQRIARTLSREEFQIRHMHTRGMIGARVSRSLKIMAETFGSYVTAGFRSGYHEFCREMYFGLESCGIKWSSTRTAVPGAFRPRVTPQADEVVPWVGLLPYWVGNILEIPHLADYGSHLSPADVDDWIALAHRHLTLCEEAHAPFIPCAHQSGLSCGGDPEAWRDTGFRTYERVIGLAREEFRAQWVTLSEIADHAFKTPHYWPQRDEYRR